MKRLLMLTLLGLSLATSAVYSADATPDKSAVTPKVIKVTAQTKTILEKGRFHVVHEKKQKLFCKDCHGKGDNDILFLRTGEFQGKDGPVDRKGCLECHQTPNTPTFYGVAK
jgi:hypothetical protein